jgi:hypothetical protein
MVPQNAQKSKNGTNKRSKSNNYVHLNPDAGKHNFRCRGIKEIRCAAAGDHAAMQDHAPGGVATRCGITLRCRIEAPVRDHAPEWGSSLGVGSRYGTGFRLQCGIWPW